MRQNMSNKSYGILGEKTTYSDKYRPDLLFPIPRAEARKELGLSSAPPFYGTDTWNAYEVSWLDPGGKPIVAIARIVFSADSRNIVESKSVKLYLNSFNMSRFQSQKHVEETMVKDLSAAVDSRVWVTLSSSFDTVVFDPVPGTCIDHLPVTIDTYAPDPTHLLTTDTKVTEQLHSNLLRTNCPVTGQPDWATVVIEYCGNQIDQESLLRYLISFRQESGFHENCIERIFIDISRQCIPEELTVYGGFTRRGGIDINPCRSSHTQSNKPLRFARQ